MLGKLVVASKAIANEIKSPPKLKTLIIFSTKINQTTVVMSAEARNLVSIEVTVKVMWNHTVPNNRTLNVVYVPIVPFLSMISG